MPDTQHIENMLWVCVNNSYTIKTWCIAIHTLCQSASLPLPLVRCPAPPLATLYPMGKPVVPAELVPGPKSNFQGTLGDRQAWKDRTKFERAILRSTAHDAFGCMYQRAKAEAGTIYGPRYDAVSTRQTDREEIRQT